MKLNKKHILLSLLSIIGLYTSYAGSGPNMQHPATPLHAPLPGGRIHQNPLHTPGIRDAMQQAAFDAVTAAKNRQPVVAPTPAPQSAAKAPTSTPVQLTPPNAPQAAPHNVQPAAPNTAPTPAPQSAITTPTSTPVQLTPPNAPQATPHNVEPAAPNTAPHTKPPLIDEEQIGLAIKQAKEFFETVAQKYRHTKAEIRNTLGLASTPDATPTPQPTTDTPTPVPAVQPETNTTEVLTHQGAGWGLVPFVVAGLAAGWAYNKYFCVEKLPVNTHHVQIQITTQEGKTVQIQLETNAIENAIQAIDNAITQYPGFFNQDENQKITIEVTAFTNGSETGNRFLFGINGTTLTLPKNNFGTHLWETLLANRLQPKSYNGIRTILS